MSGTRAIAALAAMGALWSCAPAPAAGPDSTLLLSRPSGLGALPAAGDNGVDQFTREAISGDGRFVVFGSKADDLGVQDPLFHIWVRDTMANTTTLVDRRPTGEPANNDALFPSISRDGGTVCFLSVASNLVDGVSGPHLYAVTLSSGTIAVVDRADGAQGALGDDSPIDCVLDATGAHAAFESSATNLVMSDTNDRRDVFVRDLGANTTERVSVDSNGMQAANGGIDPAITADGLKVAFAASDPLIAGDTNMTTDVFINDTQANSLTRVSVATGGVQASGGSSEPSISDDGMAVAFTSSATNLSGGVDPNGEPDVFLRRIGSDTTSLMSRADGTLGAFGDNASGAPSISGDGLGVAFESSATNLGAGAPPPPLDRWVYLRRPGPDETILLSRADGASGAPADASGNAVSLATTRDQAVWTSRAQNLDADASGEFPQVYKRDLTEPAPPTTTLVSRPEGDDPRSSGVNDSFVAGPRALSADGRRAVIRSNADALDPAGAARFQHVFVRDTLTNTLALVDRAAGAGGEPGNAGAQGGSISPDGRRVAFFSEATNLLPGGNPPGIFVRDLETDELFLASRNAAGDPLPDVGGFGVEPTLNLDGTLVAFSSGDQPATGEDTNDDRDIYVRDLSAGTTTLVSLGPAGVGDSDSRHAAISADGTRVAFSSDSSNLIGEPVPPGTHVYVRDRTAGATVLADRSTDGMPGAGSADSPVVSSDGNRVLFRSSAALTPEPLPPGGQAVSYVRDLEAQTTTLATRGDGPSGAAVAPTGGAALSHDGGHVSFSGAVPALSGTPEQPQVYVRDLAAQTLTLASSADGTPGTLANGSSGGSALSADGGCVAFDSLADNLTDPNYGTLDFSQVYLRVVFGECPKPPVGPGGNGPGGGGNGLDQDAPGFIGRILLARRVLRAAARGDSAILSQRRRRRRRPVGTRVTFRLDEAATVAFTVERARPGRRVRGRCVRPNRRNRARRRCRRFVLRRGSFAVPGAAGETRFRFTGRLRNRKLRRGRYRLVGVATDAAGNRSQPRRARFRIVRR